MFGRRTVDTTGDKPKTIAVVSEKEVKIKLGKTEDNESNKVFF